MAIKKDDVVRFDYTLTGPDGRVLDSSVQVLPLESIGHVGMRTLVAHDDVGRRIDRGVYLVLATAMPHELSAVAADPDSPLPIASGERRIQPSLGHPA